MRRLPVLLDDDLANLLEKYPNQSQIVRDALRLYIGDITTDTKEGLRTSYRIIAKYLQEIDSKIDYIAANTIKK